MPSTGIVLALLGVHLAVFLILLGHWVAAAGFAPKTVERLVAIYDERPIRATLIGLFTYGPITVVSLSGKLGGLGALLGFAALFIALIGSSGIALRIGRNLAKDVSVWNQALRGSVVLALVFITPALGWVLINIGLASGFGAVLMAKPWKKAAATAAVIEEAPAPSLS